MSDTLTAPANFIAGEWRPSAGGDTYEKRNPARPDEVVGEFPSSAREDVDLAVEAAAAALPAWSRGPIAKRAAVLSAAADLIEERARDAPPPPPPRPRLDGGAPGGDRRGHAPGEGKAAARGAHGGGAGRAD